MLAHSLRSRWSHAAAILGSSILLATLACNGERAPKLEMPASVATWQATPSVDSVALFGMGLTRACAYLHLTLNVSAGTESNFSQRQCRDTLRTIHERHLDRDDRILLSRFRNSRTFTVMQRLMNTSDDDAQQRLPGACNETQIAQLRIVAKPAFALASIPMAMVMDTDSNWMEGMLAESMVVALSPLCDELPDDALEELARVAAAPATAHSLDAARETAAWVARTVREARTPLP